MTRLYQFHHLNVMETKVHTKWCGGVQSLPAVKSQSTQITFDLLFSIFYPLYNLQKAPKTII